MPSRQQTILCLALNIVKMEIYITFFKNIRKFHNPMHAIYSKRYCKVWSISMKTTFCLEIWNYKIFYLMRKENLKLLILDFRNLKYLKKISHILIVAVHNTWLLRCFQSIPFFNLGLVIRLKLIIMHWEFCYMNSSMEYLHFMRLKNKTSSWQSLILSQNSLNNLKYPKK